MINIAEILKDCPKRTKLYSTICGDCTYTEVDEDGYIMVMTSKDTRLIFNKYGQIFSGFNSECLLFPSKENRDWNTFQTPFKDGDIIARDEFIVIFSHSKQSEVKVKEQIVHYHCCLGGLSCFKSTKGGGVGYISDFRFATDEEKQKLFDAIKENGYKWNAETKTLEELIKPKFKVGDRIQFNKERPIRIIKSLEYDRYRLDNGNYLRFGDEGGYKLLKFDISTLKPFDKVLVRNNSLENWHIQFFEKYNRQYGTKYPYICMCGNKYSYCIPYEDNKHLLDTIDDCEEFYKTW